jgi:mannosyltransferase
MNNTLKSIFRFFKARPRTDYLFVAIGLIVFCALTLTNISQASIWFDEAFSAYLINYNFLDIARYTATDVHPPFYYWLLKAWSMLFGTTELALRSMSVLFGVLTALFSYLFVRRQFGRRAGLFALAILILSPLFIRYSQEARMYTLAAAIVMSATYVLIRALETRSRKLWIVYGILVSLGMWTHYFTALAWIAHWVWRYSVTRQSGARGKVLAKKFFDKNWLMAHIIAVGLFLPWLPAMVIQLVVIQTGGFWIIPVGVDTFSTYFGTLVYFLEHDRVTGWLAAGLLAGGAFVTYVSLRTYKKGSKFFKRNYLLVLAMAAVPPIVLFIVSLPPLTSSFVERYLLPAAVASALFMGITLAYGLKSTKIWQQVVVYVTIASMLIFGLTSMFYYGNYNKNSRTGIETKQLVQQAIEKSAPGQPIIASTPWVFYEAIFYNSDEHPIYFIDAEVDYRYGSLDMLKYSDKHKIKDLDAFTKQYPTVWYIGYAEGELTAPASSWVKIDETSITNRIDGKTVYKGIEYQAR